MHENTANNGRDERGLFRAGNTISRGVGGNPNVKKMAEFKKALIACGSDADIQSLYRTLMAAALAGDVQAAKLLLDHLVGRPSQAIELTGLDADPIKVDMSNLTTVLMTALGGFPEARYAVAGALRQISLNKGQGDVTDGS